MTAQHLFKLASVLAEAVGCVERWHARAASATNDNDRAAHIAKATTWEALAATRREHLRVALDDALRGTVRAVPDDELPVATWRRGQVEVRAITAEGTRAVRVRYTPAQALAAGAALIACAAITDEHTGGTLADILATFPPNPRPNASPTPSTEDPDDTGSPT